MRDSEGIGVETILYDDREFSYIYQESLENDYAVSSPSLPTLASLAAAPTRHCTPQQHDSVASAPLSAPGLHYGLLTEGLSVPAIVIDISLILPS